MSANSPVNISLDLDKSKIFDDPVRNIVPFNSLIICSENLERFSLDSEAALRNGYAIAHIFAPSDIHFAISRPFRMPPDAINGSSTELRTSIKLKAVEFIHNFSLVHDDIMDNDDLRHGIPTVHKNYGLPLAILSGDILFSKAFQILSTNNTKSIKESSLLSMIRKLSSACIDICEGQCKDLQFSRAYNFPTEDEYIQMIAKKTAALFEVSCSLGALSSRDATENDVNNMANFGKNSGIAFQLIDDLIGISGDIKKTGKAVGNDIREGKKTYPILLSINKASELERSQILKVFGKSECESMSLKKAIDIISSLQIENIVRKNAMDYINKAMESINHYKDSDPKNFLQEISHFIVERSK